MSSSITSHKMPVHVYKVTKKRGLKKGLLLPGQRRGCAFGGVFVPCIIYVHASVTRVLMLYLCI